LICHKNGITVQVQRKNHTHTRTHKHSHTFTHTPLYLPPPQHTTAGATVEAGTQEVLLGQGPSLHPVSPGGKRGHTAVSSSSGLLLRAVNQIAAGAAHPNTGVMAVVLPLLATVVYSLLARTGLQTRLEGSLAVGMGEQQVVGSSVWGMGLQGKTRTQEPRHSCTSSPRCVWQGVIYLYICSPVCVLTCVCAHLCVCSPECVLNCVCSPVCVFTCVCSPVHQGVFLANPL